MSIVVASDNPHLVESLRGFFLNWGLSPVYSCKTAIEFNTILKQSKRPIRVLMMDGDLGSRERAPIRNRFETEPMLEFTTKGWIVSSNSPIWALPPKDFHFGLGRPFGPDSLFQSVFQGAKQERLAHPMWLHLGSAGPSVSDQLRKSGIFEALLPSDPRLIASIEPKPMLGVLLIQPDGLTEETIGWLRRFRKSPHGNHTFTVCLTQSVEAIRPIRTLCQLFLPSPQNAEQWRSCEELIRKRWLGSLEVETRMTAFKHALKLGNTKASCRQLKNLQNAHPEALETLIAAGRANMKLGRSALAKKAYLNALTLDPCNPEIYAQLMSLEPDRSTEGERIQKLARQYCPNCPELFEARETGKSASPVTMASDAR